MPLNPMQSGFQSNSNFLTCFIYSLNSFGILCSSDNFSSPQFIFFSQISWYFNFLSEILTPYHGRLPLIRQNSRQPMHSMSSRRDCSQPMCVQRLAYRAVPVRLLSFLKGMCSSVLTSRYRLESPRSIAQIQWALLLTPNRKLSGLRSLCRNPLECIYSTRWII